MPVVHNMRNFPSSAGQTGQPKGAGACIFRLPEARIKPVPAQAGIRMMFLADFDGRFHI